MGSSKVFRLVLKHLFFAGLISVSVSLSKQKNSRTYNERCVPYDSSASCDSDQNLLCLDSGLKGYRCACPSNKLHAQMFDHKRNSCVGKAFNACVPSGNFKTNGFLNETLCVPNAYCDNVMFRMPVCICKHGFIDTEDGTCVPALKHGESCYDPSKDDSTSSSTTSKTNEGENDEQVNKEKKCEKEQTCVEGKCQCRYPSEQYYDSTLGKCISYAGGRCTHGDAQLYSCIPNAQCPIPPPQRLHGSASHNRNPSISLLPPLPPFLGGLVQAAAASSSSREGDDGDEDTTIFMMPFRPRLPPPHHHHHHRPPHGHHPMLSRDDPLMDFDNYDFVARSIFFGSGNKDQKKGVQAEGDDLPRCQCLPGFSRTSDGFCMKSYLSKCSPDDDDNTSLTGSKTRELCNSEQFLECMDAHDGSFSCQCRNQMNERYDEERKECVAMIGRMCRSVGNYPKCQNGSECVNGICECINGTSVTPMQTCAKNYQQGCEPGQCNGYRGLTCHGKSKTCLCVDSFLRYDEKKDACVASKGSFCGSMKSSNRYTSSMGNDAVYVECEDGTECRSEEIGGKKMASRCL